jgi:hypothetical protein
MITDGYENAPAGRVNEVVHAVRNMGISTPIYQVTSVIGAESSGVRKLSDKICPMPVSKPSGIGLSLVRAAIGNDLKNGIVGLLATARPLLEGKKG